MHTGIAVLYKGELITGRLLYFRGKWSEAKREQILSALPKLFASYSVGRVAVKIPDVFPDSQAFSQTLGLINNLCEREGIQAEYYTLSHIKRQYAKNGVITKAAIISHLAHAYPELLHEYRKVTNGKARHYIKVFEAIAAALC
jgi:hypothetical protein